MHPAQVSFAVLPTGAESTTVHAHPLVIYELPDDGAYVAAETYARELTLTGSDIPRREAGGSVRASSGCPA